MGELINILGQISDSQIPSPIARDEEFKAADAAHLEAPDPHSQYEFRAGIASKILTGSRSFPANTWTSLGAFPGFPLGIQGAPSAILIAINFCQDINYPWQQACCAAVLGTIWWQPAVVADLGVRVPLEVHNVTGHFLSIRAGGFSQDLRPILINPESTITIPSVGRVDVVIKRLI